MISKSTKKKIQKSVNFDENTLERISDLAEWLGLDPEGSRPTIIAMAVKRMHDLEAVAQAQPLIEDEKDEA